MTVTLTHKKERICLTFPKTAKPHPFKITFNKQSIHFFIANAVVIKLIRKVPLSNYYLQNFKKIL